MAKYSYYAGFLDYEDITNVLKIQTYYQNFSIEIGWQNMIPNFSKYEQQIKPYNFSLSKEDFILPNNACEELIIDKKEAKRSNDDGKIIIPLPKLEKNEVNPIDVKIWLPFKDNSENIDLTLKPSRYNLANYYILAIDCQKSLNINNKLFQNKLSNWLSNNVYPLLKEPTFYPGLANVLRIKQSLKQIKIGQTANNDNEEDDDYDHIADQSEQFKRIQDQIKQQTQNKSGFFHNLFFQSEDTRTQHKFIVIGICLAFIIFISVVFIAGFIKREKRKLRNGNSHESMSLSNDNGKQKKRAWFRMLNCCEKKSTDEEIEIGPESPSVVHKNRVNRNRKHYKTGNNMYFF